MTSRKAAEKTPEAKAEHGAPSEVNWDGGTGRQPYANQGARETVDPAHGEFSAGDRGELSGRNREQLEKIRKVP